MTVTAVFVIDMVSSPLNDKVALMDAFVKEVHKLYAWLSEKKSDDERNGDKCK